MNLIHLKYAVEVAKTHSISKAAENLYMGQPNLSRAIKELEESLGITIFRRTARGNSVTPDGNEFLQRARRIVAQVEEVEEMYQSGSMRKQSFSACVPRASYFSNAFAAFSQRLSVNSPAEIFYNETNSMRTIDNIVRGEFNIGIVRYQSSYEKYFKEMFSDKRLVSETVSEFSYLLIVKSDSPLAQMRDITLDDLKGYIQITHADPYVPTLPLIDVKKAEISEYVDKHIYVYERATQWTLLKTVPNTFMWTSPVPQQFLNEHSLVVRRCSINPKVYKDVLIYRQDYQLTELDKQYLADVAESKKQCGME